MLNKIHFWWRSVAFFSLALHIARRRWWNKHWIYIYIICGRKMERAHQKMGGVSVRSRKGAPSRKRWMRSQLSKWLLQATNEYALLHPSPLTPAAALVKKGINVSQGKPLISAVHDIRTTVQLRSKTANWCKIKSWFRKACDAVRGPSCWPLSVPLKNISSAISKQRFLKEGTGAVLALTSSLY